MTCAALSTVIYLGLFTVLLVGVACCFDIFLCSASNSEQAYTDGADQLRRANRDVESRERLKQSSSSSF